MEITLCSVPVETPGGKLRRKRSEGTPPIQPKLAISSLHAWSKSTGLKIQNFLISICFILMINLSRIILEKIKQI